MPNQGEMLDRVAAVTTVARYRGALGILGDEKPLVVPLDGALHGLAERCGTLGRRAGMLGRVVAQSYPAREARASTAVTKSRCSVSRRKLMASPCAWHPKQ